MISYIFTPEWYKQVRSEFNKQYVPPVRCSTNGEIPCMYYLEPPNHRRKAFKEFMELKKREQLLMNMRKRKTPSSSSSSSTPSSSSSSSPSSSPSSSSLSPPSSTSSLLFNDI